MSCCHVYLFYVSGCVQVKDSWLAAQRILRTGSMAHAVHVLVAEDSLATVAAEVCQAAGLLNIQVLFLWHHISIC